MGVFTSTAPSLYLWGSRFVQMALGLHYMHENRVLHRDLKTQNIFLLGNGRLVLGDLGISKVLEGTMDFAETCIGHTFCIHRTTHNYRAPQVDLFLARITHVLSIPHHSTHSRPLSQAPLTT